MPSGPDEEFGDPSQYPYLCVASPSCHDTSTTRAWYEEDEARQQRYFNQASLLHQQLLYALSIQQIDRA